MATAVPARSSTAARRPRRCESVAQAATGAAAAAQATIGLPMVLAAPATGATPAAARDGSRFFNMALLMRDYSQPPASGPSGAGASAAMLSLPDEAAASPTRQLVARGAAGVRLDQF